MLTKDSVTHWIHDITPLQDAYIIKMSHEHTDHVNKQAALVMEQCYICLMFFDILNGNSNWIANVF